MKDSGFWKEFTKLGEVLDIRPLFMAKAVGARLADVLLLAVA